MIIMIIMIPVDNLVDCYPKLGGSGRNKIIATSPFLFSLNSPQLVVIAPQQLTSCLHSSVSRHISNIDSSSQLVVFRFSSDSSWTELENVRWKYGLTWTCDHAWSTKKLTIQKPQVAWGLCSSSPDQKKTWAMVRPIDTVSITSFQAEQKASVSDPQEWENAHRILAGIVL